MCLLTGSLNMKPKVHVSKDESELTANVQQYLAERISYLSEQNGTIGIGVSGGSMITIFSNAILSIKNLNWKKIRIFMVDERNVATGDPESNHGEYIRKFPENLRDVIVPVPIYENVQMTAEFYEMNLRKYLLPDQFNSCARFDILLLGVGPDGHTASIFPGDRLEKCTDLNWVAAVFDSPKPPPTRVTLTMNIINHAKNVAFIITGKQKAEIVRGILEQNSDYPAAHVRPVNDKLDMFLDEEAATGIPLHESPSTSSPEPDSPPANYEG
ncbi:unnamed protein product [Caenorhabditis sp. 36 PRJEB53466]|nr:unnamed protein product [Caenorhabditis sp. 36 PRJEB53466]